MAGIINVNNEIAQHRRRRPDVRDIKISGTSINGNIHSAYLYNIVRKQKLLNQPINETSIKTPLVKINVVKSYGIYSGTRFSFCLYDACRRWAS
jgi:hypothetical protein